MNKAKKRLIIIGSHGNISMSDTTEPVSSNEDDILYCDYCKSKLPDKSSLKQHLLGQKHKKLYDTDEQQKIIQEKCGLFVKGFPPSFSEDAILDYFLTYGKVVWIHFGKHYVLVDYSKPSTAEEFMKQKHYINNRQLVREYRVINPGKSKKEEENEALSIINNVKNVETLDGQVTVLVQNLRPHAYHQFPKYQQVCADLQYILLPEFPYCQIHPFGSTITGLNFQNSDVDVYISGIKLYDQDDVPYLYRTKKRLAYSRRFSRLIVIRHAKIPILRCVHMPTGINCDINIKNMLGVCNSQLINYYLNINPKIKLLMMLIKYWAKVHGISGKSNLFSNYSLTMMLIFFLQHQPYDIPSVLYLQQNLCMANFQDGWNGGFQAMPFISMPLVNTPLLEILDGFFQFYAEFEFGINVICPYLGGTIKKDMFLTPALLPDCFNVYKEYIQFGHPLNVNACVCIQDPFEHCRNTTPIISVSVLNRLVSFCRLGRKLCREGETDLLHHLLTEEPQDLKSEVVIESDFTQFFVPMQPSLKYIESKYDNIPDRQNAWFNSIVEFTTVMLKDILKLEITGENALPSDSKNRRLNGQSDIHEKIEIDGKSYLCSGKLNLWQGRKSVKNNISEESKNRSTIIEKQTALTNELCNLYREVPQINDIINFEISLEFDCESSGVIVRLKKHNAHKNSFKSFAMFFVSNLPLWFNTYEREQNGC